MNRRALPSRWLDVLFGLAWATGAAFYVLQRFVVADDHRFVLPPALLLTALLLTLVLWPALSWERGPTWARAGVSAAFCVCVLVTVLDTLGAIVLVALAAVHLVFVFRVWVAAAYVVVFAAENAVATSVADASALVTAITVVFVLLFYGALVGCAELVRRGRADKFRVEALLENLERAHRTLRERAERIRELTLADERARLSRDMHDSVGQHLTAASVALRTALRAAGSDRAHGGNGTAEAWSEVEQARQLVVTALEETRRTVRALRPSSLQESSVSDALHGLVESFRSRELGIELEIHGPVDDLGEDEQVLVFRTAQEALTNVVRHSSADHVAVSLRGVPSLRLRVGDNGHDLTAGEASGCGLDGLRERAHALGAEVRAEQTARGFTVDLELPRARPATRVEDEDAVRPT